MVPGSIKMRRQAASTLPGAAGGSSISAIISRPSPDTKSLPEVNGLRYPARAFGSVARIPS